MLQQRKANCIRHTACESCGSSDANAEYDDGTYFCFSCNTYTPATRKPQAVSYTHLTLPTNREV